MTQKNNRAPLLCYFKLFASFRSHSRVTLYTAGHLHTAVPNCSHSRAPIVHTAVPQENNEHGCVYLRCRAVCKLPGCVEGHPCHWWIQTGVTVRKHLIRVKIDAFFSCVTLKLHGWPWKTIGHLFYATSSFVQHFVAIGEFKLELQSGNAQQGSHMLAQSFFPENSLRFPWNILKFPWRDLV